MTRQYVLAVDQGTTGSTVLVFDEMAAIKGRAYAEITQHFPRPGWVEHDAEEIWNVTRGAIERALASAGIESSDLAAIGITNQRETTVLWERSTGRPVHPAIVWQDRRTADACQRLREAGHEEAIRRKTGLVIDPYFSATKVQWLLNSVAGLREAAERGEIAFGTVDSWLIWKLTGGRAHVTDPSNASRTALFNIHDLAWDAELLDLFGVPRALLAEVAPTSGVCGYTEPALFPGAAAIAIAGMAGDQQAALFGQACFAEGQAKNTYGTGCFLLMNTGTRAVDGGGRLLSTIAWKLGDEPVTYAVEGAIFVTGAAVQWLRDGLAIIAHAGETEALAASLAGNDDVYFVPALAGLGAPHWDPYARGVLVGITRGTTRAHLARAVLESIAYQTCDVVEAMERNAGIALSDLRCDGGAVVNGFLMQFQSDILGVPVAVPEVSETTALGAAYLAGLAVGYWRSREDIQANWRVGRRYQPQLADEDRMRLLRRWRRAVERAKGWARDDDD
jgi:glycerol kinase